MEIGAKSGPRRASICDPPRARSRARPRPRHPLVPPAGITPRHQPPPRHHHVPPTPITHPHKTQQKKNEWRTEQHRLALTVADLCPTAPTRVEL